MRIFRRLDKQFECLLALIVLFASVAAPYRNATGRVLLFQLQLQDVDTLDSETCIRVLSQPGVNQGMRVVATCPRSPGPNIASARKEVPIPPRPTSSSVAPRQWLSPHLVSAAIIPLRC